MADFQYSSRQIGTSDHNHCFTVEFSCLFLQLFTVSVFFFMVVFSFWLIPTSSDLFLGQAEYETDFFGILIHLQNRYSLYQHQGRQGTKNILDGIKLSLVMTTFVGFATV